MENKHLLSNKFVSKPDAINDKGLYAYDPKVNKNVHAVSKCQIFKEIVYFKKTDDRLTFYRAGLDYVGKTLKSQQKSGAYQFSAQRLDLEPGYYPLHEEESNEDQAVFLLK